MIDSVVKDGWPQPMVELGFELHAETWNVDAALEGLESDSERYEGPRTTDRSIAHLWPALPGAGVAPVLQGYLLGVREQWVKPSRDGREFGRRFVEICREYDDDSFRLCDREWDEADHVVVSGADETIAQVIERVGRERTVGYGHRVSAAFVGGEGAVEHVGQLARDVVLWHQLGCFSARAVFLVGGKANEFGPALASAIATAERDLDALTQSDAELASRAQQLGLAEFETDVWRAEFGWVELRDSWSGDWLAPHAVTPRPLTIVV